MPEKVINFAKEWKWLEENWKNPNQFDTPYFYLLKPSEQANVFINHLTKRLLEEKFGDLEEIKDFLSSPDFQYGGIEEISFEPRNRELTDYEKLLVLKLSLNSGL
jgi:hypothetical protein